MKQWRKILLFPLGIIYHAVTAGRNLLYDVNLKKSTAFNIPIIGIGNIAIGGTGKTPHTEYLIRLFQKDYNIATLSRGYGRTTTSYTEAKITSTSKEIGDEPAQYKRKFPSINVVVENKRVKGVQQLLKNHPNTNLVLLDDAYQHRAIKAGLNIVVTDYNNPLANDYLLPAGNLRESKRGIKRADIVIVSKCPDNLSEAEQTKLKKALNFHSPDSIYFTKVQYGKIYHVFTNDVLTLPTKQIDVVLVSGIGKPKPLQAYVQKEFNTMIPLAFADHHEFSNSDIKTIVKAFNDLKSEQKIILTTEKDASRLLNIKELSQLPIYCLEIEVAFLNKKDKFSTQIETYVRTNKANG